MRFGASMLRAPFAKLLVVAGTGAIAVSALAAPPDRRPPRIVAAVMQDLDRDARTDRVRLTYSERIRHVRDRDGRYPFTIAGYRIRAIGAANGKTLVIALV